jgi:hypothetical protein
MRKRPAGADQPASGKSGGTLLFVVSRIFRLRFGTALGFGGERSEKFFLGKLPMEHILARHFFRRRQSLRLVHLCMALQALDELFPKLFGLQGFVRDFAEGDNGVLVPVALNQRLGATGKLASAEGGNENEIKSVWDLIDTIFDSDACHSVLW